MFHIFHKIDLSNSFIFIEDIPCKKHSIHHFITIFSSTIGFFTIVKQFFSTSYCNFFNGNISKIVPLHNTAKVIRFTFIMGSFKKCYNSLLWTFQKIAYSKIGFASWKTTIIKLDFICKWNTFLSLVLASILIFASSTNFTSQPSDFLLFYFNYTFVNYIYL